jgi:hypothetical protein
MPSGAGKWTRVPVLVLVVVVVSTGASQLFSNADTSSNSDQTGLHASLPPAYEYYNETYHLVNYDPLTAYVNAHTGFEYPTLSSDTGQAVGIYYVQNETNGKYPFVEQSLATDSVTAIADIIPLYQRFAGYTAMIDNEFFLDYGYNVALFFGTTTAAGGDYSLELVNLTTGYLYVWNTTSATSPDNQQAQYLGDDIVAVISANESIEGFNLSSHQQWDMYPAGLGFFEANNIYWVPQMDQLINVEADSGTGDEVEVLGEGVGVDPTFTLEQTIAWSSGHPVNGVNGIGFNASYSTGTPAIIFSAEEGASDSHLAFNVLLPYVSNTFSSTNRLTLAGDSITGGCGSADNSALAIQRYVFTSQYFACTVRSGAYPTFVWDPWNGKTQPTNITPVNSACFNLCFEGLYAPSLAYLLNLNATAKLAGGPTAPPYNVVYDYLNASQPYPAPLGSPTLLKVTAVTTTTIVLNWTNPAGVLLNDTVYEGTSCGTYSTNVSLGGAGTSYAVTGLASATSLCFAVASWNSTGQTPLSAPVTGTTLPEAPTLLAVTALTQNSTSLSWANPSGTLINDTVFWTSSSCGTYPQAVSTQGVATSVTVTGLAQGATYCFAVEAWSMGGPSALSLSVSQKLNRVPAAPTGLTVGNTTTSSVELTWSNPKAGLLNDTVYEGSTCGKYLSNHSLGSVGTTYTEAGLASATSYCFAVSSWNATGQSPLSSGVYATTLPTAPTGLTVFSVTSSSISLGWTNPTGALVNVTVFWTDAACGDYRDAATLGGPGNFYTITGLKAGATYCIAIKAWSAGGPSLLSPTVSQMTLAQKNSTVPVYSGWPPVFGWPNLNPYNWVGLAALAAGTFILLRYKRVIPGSAFLGAGLLLLFLIAI